MSYDVFLDNRTSDIEDTVKRLEKDFTDRRDAEDRERTRRYISFLKADRESMSKFNWAKEGVQFLPQIVHDLCEVEAFLRTFKSRISWRPGLEFSSLMELYITVCKDYLSMAESYEKYYGPEKRYSYLTIADFVKELEES